MDKYEYKLKLEQLRHLVEEKDYETAAEIADTINWRKVKSASTLCMVGEIYDRNKQYENSRDILLMAYDRATVGRNIIYRLALVSMKMGRLEEAKEYYDEFLEIAPYDNLKYVLRYQIAKMEGASLEQQIEILEEFKSREYTEEWAFELAYLYHRSGNSERCVEVCDELVLWFGDGKYVEKALELKMLHHPLNKDQEEKYRQFKTHQDGTLEIHPTEMMESGEIIQDTVRIPDLTAESGRFNTLNLQEELVKGMQQIIDADTKETVTDTMDSIKKIVEEIPYLQVPQEEGVAAEEEEWYGHIETDKEIDDYLETDFQEMLAEDWDGQISLSVPGGGWWEPQVNGQMKIEDVLAEWEKTKRAAEAAMAVAQQRKLESAKARALQEAEELMERLNQIIPKLNAGITPQELLAERYLQSAKEDLEETFPEPPQVNLEIPEIREAAKPDLDMPGMAGQAPEMPGMPGMAGQAPEMPEMPETEEEAWMEYPQNGSGPYSEEAFLEHAETGGQQILRNDFGEMDFGMAGAEEPLPEIDGMDKLALGELEAGISGMEMPQEIPDTGMYQAGMPDMEAPQAGMPDMEMPQEIPDTGMYQAGMPDMEMPQEIPDLGMYQAGMPDMDMPQEMPDTGMYQAGMPDMDMPQEIPDMETPQAGVPDMGMPQEMPDMETPQAGMPDMEAPQAGMPDMEAPQAEAAGQKMPDMDMPQVNEALPKEVGEGVTKTEETAKEQAGQEPAKPEKKDAESYLESVFQAAKASREAKDQVSGPMLEPEASHEISEVKVHLDDAGGIVPDVKIDLDDGGAGIPKTKAKPQENIIVPEVAAEPGQETVRKLSEEEREIFSYFVPVTGMEQQLCQVLEGVLHRKGKSSSSSSGNILIMGCRGSGKTVLATDIIKAIQKDEGHSKGKVGKITGESLNQKDLSQLLKKVAGGYLIIERAGEMTQETVTRLSLLMDQDTDGLLFILEDTRKGIEKVLSLDMKFAKKFTERIKIPVFTSDELVEFAKAYADEQECEIDDMGILALYNRISNIQKLDEATTLTEVKEIVDMAISSAERGGLKKLFGGKKFSPEGYLYLREKDFEE